MDTFLCPELSLVTNSHISLNLFYGHWLPHCQNYEPMVDIISYVKNDTFLWVDTILSLKNSGLFSSVLLNTHSFAPQGGSDTFL